MTLPLIFDSDLIDPGFKWYVTFKTGNGNETMSGHVIGQRNNGDLLVDPGGSAANIVEVKQDQITTVEDL